MSDNIIPFPAKDIRDWTIISQTIREILTESSLAQNEIDEFLVLFKPIFKSFQFECSITVPDSCPEEINQELARFSSALQQHTAELMLDRFRRELDFFLKGE